MAERIVAIRQLNSSRDLLRVSKSFDDHRTMMQMTVVEQDGLTLTCSIVAVLAPFSVASLSLTPSLSIISTLLSLSSSVSATGLTMKCGDGAGATWAAGLASPLVTYSSNSFTLILSRGERV